MARVLLAALALVLALDRAALAAPALPDQVTELARSDDGKLQLRERVLRSSQGGALRSYELSGASGLRVIYSDTLPRDAGGPSQEALATAACEQRLTQLQGALATGWSQARLTLHPERCATLPRRRLVSVAAP